MSKLDLSTDRFPYFVVWCGIAIGLVYQVNLWTFDEQGFSILSDRLPYWDFTNLWAGGALALEGKVHALFSAEGYRAALRAMLHPSLPNQEWSYPPSMLLLGMPLATLPIMLAYLIWTFATVALLWIALRPFDFPMPVRIAIIASPAIIMNSLFGQNGALTAALLLGGLWLVPTRPILAGIAFGVLTTKPHLGILIPFCLLAGGHWRAIFSATATLAGLIVATGLLVGFDVWPLFFTETRALMTEIMEAPYPQLYHANAVTTFVMAQWVGTDLNGAYIGQLGVSLVALGTAVKLWLPSSQTDHQTRVILTAVCAILATPYGYSYDLVPYCVAVAHLFLRTDRVPHLVLAILWLFPLFVHMFNFQGIAVGVLPIMAVYALLVRLAFKGRTNISPKGARTAA